MAPAVFGQLTTDVLDKAPPAIDDALRARIKQFYQFHVDGKFRQAEQLVAEESKDFFYAANKPKYVGFEITRIEYSDNFTKAKATMVCLMYVMMPGFADKPLPVPAPSYWKLVDGQWYWYVDSEIINMTPFGKVKSSGDSAGSGKSLPRLPTEAEAMRMLDKVKLDKTGVQLTSGAPSRDEIVVVNELPGPVTVTVSGAQVEGLTIQVEPPSIPSGGKGVVAFRYTPGKTKPAASLTANIHIEQTGRTFPVQIAFAP